MPVAVRRNKTDSLKARGIGCRCVEVGRRSRWLYFFPLVDSSRSLSLPQWNRKRNRITFLSIAAVGKLDSFPHSCTSTRVGLEMWWPHKKGGKVDLNMRRPHKQDGNTEDGLLRKICVICVMLLSIWFYRPSVLSRAGFILGGVTSP